MRATTTPAAAPSQVSSTWRWSVICLLALGVTIAYVERANISVALVVKDFQRLFHLSDADRGMLNSAFFWSYAFLQIPAGWIVDRYGVKRPYAIAYFVWSVLSAAAAMASTLSQLVVLRVLLGVAESIVTPASMRWIRFHFSEKERGLAIGMYMT